MMSADETSLTAWRMAIKNRPIRKGLIFHSDFKECNMQQKNLLRLLNHIA